MTDENKKVIAEVKDLLKQAKERMLNLCYCGATLPMAHYCDIIDMNRQVGLAFDNFSVIAKKYLKGEQE